MLQTTSSKCMHLHSPAWGICKCFMRARSRIDAQAAFLSHAWLCFAPIKMCIQVALLPFCNLRKHALSRLAGNLCTDHKVLPYSALQWDRTPTLWMHLCRGTWRSQEFKDYNFNALGLLPQGGHLHPLMKVRSSALPRPAFAAVRVPCA